MICWSTSQPIKIEQRAIVDFHADEKPTEVGTRTAESVEYLAPKHMSVPWTLSSCRKVIAYLTEVGVTDPKNSVIGSD